jgi:preprotein translocase subunit SecG
MQEAVLIIHLVIAVALVIVILMQRSEGGAASLTGGSAPGGFMTARGAANFLTRLTAILATAFIVTSLILAFLLTGGAGEKSVVDKVPVAPAPAQPAAPKAPAVPFSE